MSIITEHDIARIKFYAEEFKKIELPMDAEIFGDLAKRLEKLILLQNTVKEFLEFENENVLTDESAIDGDGYIDVWQSTELSNILEKLKEHSGFIS